MSAAVNIADFNLEDAYLALLKANGVDLLGAPVFLSMASADFEETHVAVIVEKLERSDDMPRSGNWKCDVHIKVVTLIDDRKTLPAGYTSLRTAHKQRCGVVRDTLMIVGLDKALEAAAAILEEGLTVQGYDFSDIIHRIEGRAWISEFVISHGNVNALSIVS